MAPGTAVILAGTKKDLEDTRAVSTEEAQEFADEQGIPYFEVSSQDNENISEMFEAVVDKAYSAEFKSEPTEQEQEEPKTESDSDVDKSKSESESTIQPRPEEQEQQHQPSRCSC